MRILSEEFSVKEVRELMDMDQDDANHHFQINPYFPKPSE